MLSGKTVSAPSKNNSNTKSKINKKIKILFV